MIKIFPSLMAAHQLRLEEEIKRLETHCDGFHLDIMDDHFVPNLTMGSTTVNQIAAITKKQLFVHLMLSNVAGFLKQLTIGSNSIVAFHTEALKNPQATCTAIKKRGLLPCIALNPSTPVSTIAPYLDVVSCVLVMAVEPGFSGQDFIPGILQKIEELAILKRTLSADFDIAVDGGVTQTNIKIVAQAGATIVCVGSAIFGTPDPVTALTELYTKAD